MTIRKRLRSLLWRVPIEQEVHEELAHHVELRTRELIDRGIDPEEARVLARMRLENGHVEAVLTQIGRQRNNSWARRDWIDELRQDLRFAWRQCRTKPGFTIAAVLTLGLGIGATTAIFSVVHAVVLKPYAYVDPDRVLLAFSMFRGNRGSWSVGNFDYFRQRLTSVEDFAADTGTSMNLADNGEPERIFGGRVTWNYFRLFGIPPAYGRTFHADEDQPGRNKVVILSHRLWQRRFGADPAMVGRSIRINNEPHDVVGIMPADMDQIGDAAEAWVPVAFTPEQLALYDEFYLTAYARQRKDVTQQQVRDEFIRVAQNLATDHPDLNRERSANVELMSAFFIGDYRTRLLVLLAAVGLVLLIACGNVANLLLARLAVRSRELAIRAAIGAGRGRIVRQVLTESLVLAALGGIAGLAIAWWSLPALIRLAPEGVPRLDTAALNGTVMTAALTLVIGSALFVGLLPAWQATRRTTLTEDLGDGKGALSGSLKPWMRQLLIGAQAALVMIVLAGAALLVRSAINLQQEPIGFDTRGVLTARIALPAAQYGEPARAREAYRQVLDRVQASPGIKFAALDSQAPLVGGGGSNGLFAEGKPDLIQSRSHFVTPGYFSVINNPLKAGRTFVETDIREAEFVMIINETLARAAFGDDNPIGKRISCCEGGPGKPHWKTVVGVVADIKTRGPAEPAQPEFYLPLMQIPDVAWTWTGRSLNIVTRGDDVASMTTAIRSSVKELDSTLPVFRIWTMEEGLRRIMAQARFNTLLMSTLGATGLILAALGIYSVIAWLVAQRTREIGVRMALGASKADVIRMMSMHGLQPVIAGLAVGFAGAIAATRLLQNQLFEIGPRDPLTLVATAAVLLIVAAGAAAIPAWRATTIDPATALRD
ncbi:MAG TPA: ABC transporter permease [Vicinamibacterales bacterium]|jgi:putative ABC transport system permease protein|nr:ABC transporter permease [Vicinamibacterales bacterium]